MGRKKWCWGENAQGTRDAESGSEEPIRCFCCSSETEENVDQDQSQCGRCYKRFLSILKGIFITFIYLISIVILLAICPIILLFTILISSLYLTVANVCIPFQSGDIDDVWKYFKKCK